MYKVTQINKDELKDHLLDEDIYLIDFSEKIASPSIKKIANLTIKNLFKTEKGVLVRIKDDEC